ncbi:MAG: hypothetical protein K8T25_21120, partial [Planctomycetia bacterium]|nr:hypothetical protein [Planctomycetia bacterium]
MERTALKESTTKETLKDAPAAAAATPPVPHPQHDDVAHLRIGEQEYELPMLTGSEGERAIDISKLRTMTGCITLDEGYVNTGTTTSAVTYLDGEEGILRYRGYPVEELAEHSDFVETSYLLIYGELPNPEQLHNFRQGL